MVAQASTCCSADCSSPQNSSAAAVRRSGDMRFQILDGRKAL